MHLHALSRRGPIYLAVSALVAAAALVSTFTPAPQAHAESGRRICKYVWMQGVGNPDGRTVSFVLDYKKDGKCPYIDRLKVPLPKGLGAWMPPPETWEAQPAPMMTCAQFQAAMHLPSSDWGGDPCTYMTDTMLYGVTSWKEGDPDPTPTTMARMWPIGDAWDFG